MLVLGKDRSKFDERSALDEESTHLRRVSLVNFFFNKLYSLMILALQHFISLDAVSAGDYKLLKELGYNKNRSDDFKQQSFDSFKTKTFLLRFLPPRC